MSNEKRTQPRASKQLSRLYLLHGLEKRAGQNKGSRILLRTARLGLNGLGPFLNAVLLADDPALDCHAWLRRGQDLERSADRTRELHWGPRTLDVDVITCHDGPLEVTSDDENLTLPHPYAHQRAFVLIPWLAADPEATLTVQGTPHRVADLVAGLDAAERNGVRPVNLELVF